MEKRIVVLQRAWVVVGEYTTDGEEVVVKNGSVVRIWGTTKGLGEIADNGPRSNTVLDPIPELRVHKLGVVFSLQCNPEKWS